MSTLFHGGTIATATSDGPAWALISDDIIVATGTGDPPAADRRFDLQGGALAPSFCDAHVHLSTTGLYESGLDLRDLTGKKAITDALEDRAPEGDFVFGGNFEDADDDPLTAADLDAALGSRPTLLARADMHSCVVSTSLLRHLDPDVEGVDRDEGGVPTGYLRENAAAQAWKWFDSHLTAEDHRRLIQSALDKALSKGVTEVHEMFVVEWRSWAVLDVLLDEIRGAPVKVVPYVATDDVERVRALGLRTIGGDYFLDGSFGSQTAWLSRPYESRSPSGSSPTGLAYRSDEEVEEFFSAAHSARMQVGVHAIGDAAIAQALRAWERVAESEPSVVSAGHRLEHFECAWDEHIRAARRLGLRISAQPAFDRFWGGGSGLYSARLGPERAAEMNRFKTMRAAGLIVGAGSDSTVTPLDPFLQMASLRDHHVPSERMTADEALWTHTAGARALAPKDGPETRPSPARKADLVWLDRDPLRIDPDELVKTEVLGTWKDGRRAWPPGERE